MTQYFGKYRGKVIDAADPRGLGRVKVTVPAVYGESLVVWAMPCAPYAGKGVGLWAPPAKGSGVWVEFEGGDPDLPIVSGGFWLEGEAPVASGDRGVIGLFSPAGALPFSGDGKDALATLLLGAPGAEAKATIRATAKGVAITVKGATITVSEDKVDIAAPQGTVEVTGAAVRVKQDGAEVSTGT